MISILDYGMGNTGSIVNMYKVLGIQAEIISNIEGINAANKIILPGVGSFDTAMRTLNEKGFLNALNKRVLEDGIPLLGICLGAQLLSKKSEEGELPGLGWIDAETKQFSFEDKNLQTALPVPHMGWNTVTKIRDSSILSGIDEDFRFYFVHSYHLVCYDDSAIATTKYGYDFVSMVQKNNIFGAQFHPEKSHKFGMKILRNFAELN